MTVDLVRFGGAAKVHPAAGSAVADLHDVARGPISKVTIRE
jgi:hypothetical protein